MNNNWLNIRVLLWHLKCTYDGVWSLSFNRFHVRWKTLIFPMAVCSFEISRMKVVSDAN